MYNNIEAKFDLISNSWTANLGNLTPGSCFVQLSFENTQSTNYEGLTFGFKFYVNDVLQVDEAFPKPPMKIKTLLSTYTIAPSIELFKNAEHRLEIWANSNRPVEIIIPINNVINPQPYPSWTLIDNEWTPPIPKPSAKGIWSWIELSNEWTCLDHQYDIGTGGSATDPNN